MHNHCKYNNLKSLHSHNEFLFFQTKSAPHLPNRQKSALLLSSKQHLESQILIHKDYMDSAGMSGISGDQELTADGIRRLAIEAFSGLLAGCLDIESLGVAGSCDVSRTLHGIVDVGAYFVQTDDKYYFSRPLGDTGDTVGITINVDHNAVTGDSIGTA